MPDRGIFLVHVMKTGGKSLGRVLGSMFPTGERYPDVDGGEGPDSKIFVDRLLTLEPDRLRRTRFFSVHMPAWVADAVAPGHLTVTVLREPVSRTVSHLRHIARRSRTPVELDEIYDDPEWRGRLVDYQTRIFAASRRDHEDDRAASEDFLTRADDEDRAALMAAFDRVWSTAITRARPLGESDLAAAIDRLDRIDEVGVTEEMVPLLERLERRLGTSLPGLEHLGAAGPAPPVPAALLTRIREDTQLDAVLYQHARRRAVESGGHSR